MINFNLEEDYFFDLVRESSPHECGSWLIALAAVHHGLDATFFRSQRDATVEIRSLPEKVTDASLLRVSDGKRQRYFYGSQSDRVSIPTLQLTRDKLKTRGTLLRKGLPVSAGGIISATDTRVLKSLVDQGVKEFVLKPVSSSLGKGVHVRQSLLQVQDLLQTNRGASFVIEQYIVGREFRVFVAGGVVRAVTGRAVACVLGNGKDTLGQLLLARQVDRARNPFTAARTIDSNEIELAFLLQGLTRTTIPALGQSVRLTTRDIPGIDSDVPDMQAALPASAADLAVKAARYLGASVCGIDLIVHPSGQAIFLEANCRPMIRMHSFPHPIGSGNLGVPEAILAQFFPVVTGERSPLEKRIDFLSLRRRLFDPDNGSGCANAGDFLWP